MPGGIKGATQNGTQNSSNLPLFGTPEQQMADPLHLFPGTAPPNPGAPSALTNSAGPNGSSINAKFFNPNSFGGYANLGPGQFNAMASRMAGPQYKPTLMPQAPQQNAPAPQMPGGAGSSSGTSNKTLLAMLGGRGLGAF